MNRKLSTLVLTLFSLALLLGLTLLGGCVAPGSGMEERVSAAWTQVSADGIVSPDELKWFADVVKSALADGAGSIDWVTTIGTGVVSIISAVTGVNIMRNRREEKLWGPPPSSPPAAPAA